MKKLLFIILITIPFIGFGQGWERTFGGIETDYGNFVQQTNDGGYIITGGTFSYGNNIINFSDIYLVKTDGNGIEQWSQTFGGNDQDVGYSVQQTTDGGYILFCSTDPLIDGLEGPRDVYLIKTDGSGNELWNKTFGGLGQDEGLSGLQTNDGGYIITGRTSQISGTSSDLYLIKTDVNGDSLWTKTYGGSGLDDWESGFCINKTNDGGYIITGYTSSSGNNDIYLIKTDSLGNSEWIKSGGGSDTDVGYSVQQTTDGGYIICGDTESFGMGNRDVYLIKTNNQGDSLWTKTFGGGDSDVGRSVQQTNDGGFIICGSTNSFGINGVYLIKTDSQGDTLWTKTFGGSGSEGSTSVQQTTDGGYIITGSTSSSGNNDIYLIKTDGNGNITSTFNIPTPSSNRKLEKVVDILGRETKPQTNIPFIEIYDNGSTEKKLIIEK